MTNESPEHDEITQMRARIAALPAEWIDDTFVTSVLVNIQAAAARRTLDQRVSDATAKRTEAINALSEPTEQAIAAAIKAETEVSALIGIRGRIPAPSLAQIVAAEPLRRAGEALVQQLRTGFALPVLHYDQEIEAWRIACQQTGTQLDPPLPTDIDRKVSAGIHELTQALDRLSLAHRSWHADAMSGSAHPVDLLGSATQVRAELIELRERFRAFEPQIADANRTRREIGLNWRPESAIAALIAR